MSEFRIGIGKDVHAFAEGRKLFIGGIEIPHSVGFVGHSDADILLHAIVDAVLGALAWGDIGTWFPDTDESFKDRESDFFLKKVWNKASSEGWKLVNCDTVLLLQAPRVKEHVPEMRKRIAEIFTRAGGGITAAQISVKATTTEQLGFIGRNEGAMATAVVLLRRD